LTALCSKCFVVVAQLNLTKLGYPNIGSQFFSNHETVAGSFHILQDIL